MNPEKKSEKLVVGNLEFSAPRTSPQITQIVDALNATHDRDELASIFIMYRTRSGDMYLSCELDTMARAYFGVVLTKVSEQLIDSTVEPLRTGLEWGDDAAN